MSIISLPLGQTADGRPVTKSVLTNAHGFRVALMDWGASILEVEVPDRDGSIANVNAVFDSLEAYLQPHPGFGSSIGRFCNRIARGRFTIDDQDFQVTVNHGQHTLHGGDQNFSHKLWQGEAISGDGWIGMRYTLVSPDGDEGFPGECRVTAEYCWNNTNELKLTYRAQSDAPTHVNLTNHSYWNLGGVDSGTARDHEAVLHAEEILAVDEDLIPTGEVHSVEGTVFDFRKQAAFGRRIDELAATKGYDHCYIVSGTPGVLRPAARVSDPKSGRVMELETTQPGMQLYLGNNLVGGPATMGLGMHDAFCLETQHYPDACNHPVFPSTLLRPGETLTETTVHRFLVQP